jgi:prepilin-type N-terminal cleavage/methylation domain-containing protein
MTSPQRMATTWRGGRAGARRTSIGAGFTLVELMVALVLAAIISMTIMIISKTAREIYDGTTKKVELSNRFRLALLTLDRDFSQWIETSNMEFFADGRGSGTRRNRQWDEGEELPDTRDGLGPGVVDGGVFGQYDELATISERHYVGADAGFDPNVPINRKIHDAYQAYFRAMTYIDGEVREANIEYMLLDPNNLDPLGNPQPPVEVHGEKMADLVLVKIVRYHDIEWQQLRQVAENFPIIRRRIEVSSNVSDFKIEYTSENQFNERVVSGFKTPAEDFDSPTERDIRPEELQAPRTDPQVRHFRKTFGYGSSRIGARFIRATAFKAKQGDDPLAGIGANHSPVRFGVSNNPDLLFAELSRGSSIYIFTESNRGAVVGAPQAQGRNVLFPSGLYTVKTNLSGQLEFYEDIDSSTWPNDQSPILYKAAFLPSAVRITLRVVDEKGQNPKTLVREVWIRRKSR